MAESYTKLSHRSFIRRFGVLAYYCVRNIYWYTTYSENDDAVTILSRDDIVRISRYDGRIKLFINACIEYGYIKKFEDKYIFNGESFQESFRYMGDSPWSVLRKQVFERDGYICQYCGVVTDTPHCDHIFPLSKGGKNTIRNLATSCPHCNLSKGSKLLEDWEEKRAKGIDVEPLKRRNR